MKQLIVNIDDFGETRGINRAALEILERGFVRSVSAAPTGRYLDEVTTLVRQFPHVSVGVHVNLSVGPPILPPAEIPSLVGTNGEFHGSAFPRLARQGALDGDETRRELRAQVRVLRDRGVNVTHWDSHQGRHLYPGFFEAILDVARQEGIPASRTHRYYLVLPPGPRWLGMAGFYLHNPRQIVTHRLAALRMRTVRRAGFRLPDRRLVLVSLGAEAVYRPDYWNLLLAQAPEGVNFIECHPGYVDEDLKRYSTVLESREKEREMFSDPDWVRRAHDAGVEPVSYHALVGRVDPRQKG
jgi:predicted glycoside hydrolase/deacetylase ChbG (UPF0249 family)